MTAYYPTLVKTFTNRVDFTDTILAEHVNSLQNEVSAIESNLGTYITTSSGWIGDWDKTTATWDSLKDRIANIEYGLNTLDSERLPTGGTSGQVLVKTSDNDYEVGWSTFDALPSQSGHVGEYLTTDGSTASWAPVVQGGETISSFLLAGC